MALRPILTYPAPVLKQRAVPVPNIGGDVVRLVEDMTIEEEGGLIAALFAVSDLAVTVPWLCVLAGARSHSASAREA